MWEAMGDGLWEQVHATSTGQLTIGDTVVTVHRPAKVRQKSERPLDAARLRDSPPPCPHRLPMRPARGDAHLGDALSSAARLRCLRRSRACLRHQHPVTESRRRRSGAPSLQTGGHPASWARTYRGELRCCACRAVGLAPHKPAGRSPTFP